MRIHACRLLTICGLAVTAFIQPPPARAEVTEITGSSRATLVQFAGPFPIQTDFNTEIVPLTVSKPPAVSRTQLDRTLPNDEVVAAGQVSAILDDPNLLGVGTPNDVGLDVGGFSDDDITSWYAEGVVQETRSIILNPPDFGGNVLTGATTRARSIITLSGVMVLTSELEGRDLTGAEVSLTVSVVQRRGAMSETVLAGEVALVGGPGGLANLGRVSGAFENQFLGIIDFLGDVPEIPVVQAVPFLGMQLPYEYDVVVGEPFILELTVRALLRTIPGRVGGAGVFGVPNEGLADILGRVKKDDRGDRLAAMIAEEVDTTGVAYENQNNAPFLFPLTSLCGPTTVQVGAMSALCCMVSAARRKRRGRCNQRRRP